MAIGCFKKGGWGGRAFLEVQPTSFRFIIDYIIYIIYSNQESLNKKFIFYSTHTIVFNKVKGYWQSFILPKTDSRPLWGNILQFLKKILLKGQCHEIFDFTKIFEISLIILMAMLLWSVPVCKNTMDSGSENNTNKEKSKVSIILYLSSGRTKTLGKVNILT